MSGGDETVRVLVHLDPKAPAHVLGLWFPGVAGGSPRSYYPDLPAAGAAAAETVLDMAARLPWSQVVDRLVDRLPYSAWWESFDPVDDASDEDVYAAATAAYKASAEAIHGMAFETDAGTFTGSMLMDMDAALAAALTPGERLAILAGGPIEQFKPGRRLTTLLEFFFDDDRLLVAAPDPSADQRVTDLALAYGLAWMADRDLWLVLPEVTAEASRERVAFIDWPVRVFTYEGTKPGSVVEPPPLVPFEVLQRFVEEPLRGTNVHDLGERAPWVQQLLDWANAAPGVEPAHRSSYLAWHCAGRQILRVKRTRTGVDITAGVNYTKPTPGLLPPHEITVHSALEAASVHRAVAFAANAAADRLDGIDAGHAEHRFQALLPSLRDPLRVRELRREIPARRAGGDTGFIDFVAVDHRRRLHVVETKLGSDEMLGLQALDYWIWATANRAALGSWLFDIPDVTAVVIDIVAASKPGSSATLGPYTAAQMEALDGQVSWRVHHVTEWESASPVITSSGTRSIATDVDRCVPPRWSLRAHQHLRAHAEGMGVALTADHRWQPASAGFGPSARHALDELTSRGLAHRYASHIRSSQAFALNLFAPLDGAGLLGLCRLVGIPARSVGEMVFEYGDDADLLGESSASSPHTTQVDVVIPAVHDDGSTQLLLVEVKLTETDFGACSAYRSPQNDRRDICARPHPFGGEPAACFQLRNHDRGGRRQYDNLLGPLSEAPKGSCCWFRDGMNQPMRNVALASALVQSGSAVRATFALCAPAAHRAIWHRWREARTTFADHSKVDLADLPAELVVAHHPDRAEALALAERYLLATALIERRHDRFAWQSRLDSWFPEGAALEVRGEDEDPWYPHIDPRPLVLAATSDRCRIQIATVEPWHPYQPHIAEITQAEPTGHDGAHCLVLGTQPHASRLVQARSATTDITRLLELRGERDPLSIDDRYVDELPTN